MPIQVLRFNTNNKELFTKARNIRTAVFVEEQKVSFEEEFDGFDDEAFQYLVLLNNKVAGTGRYRKTENGFKLERFAVYKEFRGKYIGAKLLETMLNDILPTHKTIYLNAQVSAQNFYAKYGFIKEGNIFVEANIEHYKMIYKGK